MAFDPGRQEPARGNWLPVHGRNKADESCFYDHHRHRAHAEQRRVHPVIARGQNLDLGALLAPVAQKRFPVLERIVVRGHARENFARGNRVSINGFHEPDFLFPDDRELILACLEQERNEHVQARTQGAGLHTHLVGHGHDTALGHALAQPAPLHHRNLAAAHYHNCLGDDDQRHKTRYQTDDKSAVKHTQIHDALLNWLSRSVAFRDAYPAMFPELFPRL